MNVLHIISKFLSPTMTFIYNEVDALSKQIDVTVVCRERMNEDKFPFHPVFNIGDGTIIDKVGNAINKKVKKTYRNYWWQTAQRLAAIIEETQPDLIHCQFGTSFVFLKDQLPNIDLPIVVSFHGFDASSALRRSSYVRQLNAYFDDKVYPIFVSNHMRDGLVAKNINFQNESILYYGTDTERFTRQNRSLSEQYNFLQVSSLTEKKGHLYTIRAFAQLLDRLTAPYPLLKIGGEGPLKEMLLKEVARLGIADHVQFLGLMNIDEVKAAMEEASCFVHHSVTADNGSKEGIPNVIMEAMAMELPILSTYHSGIPELVEDGVNGYLIAEKAVDSYAQKMEQIMSWSYIEGNRNKIEATFQKEKRTMLLLDIYKKAIAGV
ncbi:MAG: glycosyltransferase family 4 protein [Bacteroidota bacterium]